MITREQVADLQPGDVVELSRASDSGFRDVTVTARGPLRRLPLGALYLANYGIRDQAGNPICGDDRTLTVVSRTPRPLYVNSDRTEPVPGDVVRDADSDAPSTWHYLTWPGGPWYDLRGNGKDRSVLPTRLRLLVDGETGFPPVESK